MTVHSIGVFKASVGNTFLFYPLRFAWGPADYQKKNKFINTHTSNEELIVV